MLYTRLILLLTTALLAVFSSHGQNYYGITPRTLDSLEAMHRSAPFDIKSRQPILLQNQQHTTSSESFPIGLTNRSSNTAITCYDTSASFFWVYDTTYYFFNPPYQLQDGKLLLVGGYQKLAPPYKTSAIALKIDLQGNLIWGKKYDSVNNLQNNPTSYYKVLELLDGTLLLAGQTTNPVSGNDDLLFTKMDPTGNIIWSKTFKSRLWGPGDGSADYFYVQQMKQDPQSGDVYFTGPFWVDGRALVRLNPLNGNIAWSRAYNSGSAFDMPFGLDIRPQAIRLVGRTLNPSQNRADVSFYQINKANGDTINTRFFTTNDTNNIKTNFLGAEPLQVANDGHYLLASKCFGFYQYLWNGTTPLFQGAVAEFDTNFNFIKAYSFNNYIESNGYNTRVTVYPDKTGFFTMLNSVASYNSDVHGIHFNNGQIQKQRVKKYVGEGIPYEPLALQLPNGGSMTIKLLGSSLPYQSRTEFLKMHPTDTPSLCIGLNSNASYIYSFGYVPSPYNWASAVISNVFEESVNKTFVATPVTVNFSPGCFQVAHCDTLDLRAINSTICVSQTLQITVYKNPECGSNIIWSYPANIAHSVAQVNDSTFNFNFTAPWSGYIYGSLPGCASPQDSILVNVLQAPTSLNLGPDTSICPGNTLVLNAHTGYASYLWQNGSTDSLFAVTAAGIYHVQTTDACGGVFKDTIVVNQRPPVPLYIGPDRTKCNNDTLQLQAPLGFLSYSWLPNYNISATNTQTITINPSVDTTYYLKAEKTPGCFGFDTVHISVYQSPAIHLGNDTSICVNQSVTLNAGAGFAQYVWSNGSVTPQININQAGIYHVSATTTAGCSSKDTFNLLSVYALPILTLDKNPELCTGSIKTFNPGTFATYLWQDGSNGSTYTTSSIGTYYVTVTNTHGCVGTDTTRITTLLPLPSNFLPSDTAICNYGTITLQALSPFATYLWSTGNNTVTATIDKPGIYWLQVKDIKGCTGIDSLSVLPKQCLKGLFVPTAFTPDGNGKNDRLKALLFGDIKNFEFHIYNRYGQQVFYTNDPNIGWDGIYRGKPQEGGTYVWQCRYALGNEPIAQQQGSVILIR